MIEGHASHATAGNKSGLMGNAVGLWHAIFLGFSHSAPAADVASLLIGVAIVAYGAMPLAMVLGVILYLMVGNTNYWYSKNVASSGGYYTFISHGLGARASAYGAWFQQFYELYTYSLFGSLGFATTLYLYFPFFQKIPYLWIGFFFIPQTAIFVLAYLGIKPSLRYVLYTGGAEALFLLASSILIIFDVGKGNTLTVFTLAPTHYLVLPLFFGLLFAADSMTGAISPVSLGEEIKEPKKNLPRAFFGSILVAGITLIVASYALTVGWGVSNMTTFGTFSNPGQIVWDRYLGPVGGIILALFIMNSYFSCGVAGMTDVSRMWFSMSRDGMVFPKSLSSIHQKYRTPHRVLILTFIIGTVITLIAGIALGPLNATISLAITSTLSWIVVKMATSAGLPIFAKRVLGKVHLLFHLIVPAVVIAMTVVIVYATFVPLPSGVLLYGALLFPIYVLLGAIIIEYQIRKNPELIKHAGKFTL
ncbi:MAG: APC family permease [Candidatus Thermoplasmatota archaeon]|nr:APC family permease [Candidatus Thermoplasmatota archaeon]